MGSGGRWRCRAGPRRAGPVPPPHPGSRAGRGTGGQPPAAAGSVGLGHARPGRGPGSVGPGQGESVGSWRAAPGASRGQGPTAAGRADVGAGLTWGPGPHGDRADVGTRPWVVGGSPAGWSGPARPVNALGALTSRLCSVPVGEQMIEWG